LASEGSSAQPSSASLKNSEKAESGSTSLRQAKKEFKVQMSENAKAGYGGYGGGKSKVIAVVFVLLLGSFGAHSFYMGQTGKGFLQLGLTLLGIGLYIAGIASYVSGAGVAIPATALVGLVLILGVSIWALVDFIRILTGGLAPEEGFDD
jgi:TM2 domain-containing membrane protein YozV